MNKYQVRILVGRFKRKSVDVFWEIYGKGIRSNKLVKAPRSILFICKGNICRSPFAERLAKKILINSLQYNIDIDSAGLDVKAPAAPPREACNAAAVFGITLEGHLSRRFQAEMYAQFDMIVAMDTAQYRTLIKNCTVPKRNIFLLPFFENNQISLKGYECYNVIDPYGKSPEEYNSCFKRIEHCIESIAKLIKAF